MSKALAAFHPSIRQWFDGKFDAPTNVQQAAWPVIASGSHTLITAPTGSGKTLTAFLWSLDRFASTDWIPGETRVVYISPLKALNNDIQRNLLGPLTELREAGDFPKISVQTRSGDTSQSDRQRMLRKPPDILITTPESLSLMLTTLRGRQALQTVQTLILDEVHSIIDNRRGVSLMTSAERLLDLTGSLQRIALSATVNPLDDVARYVGGYAPDGSPRQVTIVNPPSEKEISLSIHYPVEVRHASENGESVWDPLALRFRELALANRSTLFFTNSRAMAEKITLKINEQSPVLLAYAHHGSLARDIRAEVERRLKNQELRAIVATSSLEMGIDIGSLDQVVLMQSPPGIAATLQRIGRAGHGVGEISRGALYPIHSADFIEAAALSAATQARDLEPLKPMTGALDILAQIIVSMCASEVWQADALYQLLTGSTPYRHLPRDHFDLVLDLLAGRYAGARVRELQARIIYNRLDGTIEAKKSALFALYNSGGSIPDRGYYQIRHADSGSKIGELDEEFVWEARTGDTFSLGTQNWQVKQITHNDVFVTQAKSGLAPPFWRAERNNRSAHYASRIGDFLESANRWLQKREVQSLRQHLTTQLAFDDLATENLIDYLLRQREISGCDLPHRHHILIELINAGPGGYRGPDNQRQLVLHTHWGGRLNHPWALALQSAWKKRYNESIEIHADNDAIVLQIKQDADPTEILALVSPANIDQHLRSSLEGSGFFGARFRECAGRFLLLPRQRFNQRLPLWMSRLQAKKLMAATLHLDNFPVMLEAWRTCLNDEFELPELKSKLIEIADGVCEWSFVQTAGPTPFAANLSFDQINRYMYADDTPEQAQVSALSEDIIKTAARDSNLRPKIETDIVLQFIAKRQRSHADYTPRDADEWTEWVKERVLLEHSHWWDQWHDAPASNDPLLCEIILGKRRWVCHLEDAAHLMGCGLADSASWKAATSKLPAIEDQRTHQTVVNEILSFYGPLTRAEIEAVIPQLPDNYFNEGDYIRGELLEGSDAIHYCDAENFDILLRWQRAARRPDFETLPAKSLAPVLANWHQFNAPCEEQTLIDAFERVRGYRTHITALLNDYFAARLKGFTGYQLDKVFSEQQLTWLGTGKQQIMLCYPEDINLLREQDQSNPVDSSLSDLFTDRNARYSFQQIASQLRATSSDNNADAINTRWWNAVWNSAITADSLLPLRQGMIKNFKLAAGNSTSTRSVSGARRRARAASAQWPGYWQLTPAIEAGTDPLTELEDCRQRVHLLLDRYGFICREIANREGGNLRWRSLFRSLRIMELSGEVLQGLFFRQLSGPQFISQRAYNRLLQKEAAAEYFWCNAVDPISPCGLGLDWPELPQRRVHNYLGFYRGELTLVIENLGRRIHLFMDATDNALELILSPCVHIATTHSKMQVDTINGENARTSPYLAAFSRVLKKRNDHRSVYFEP
ncbi:hypothetical protein AB833_11860 [Chromatiales bacterium (ex Bugula neritina AB1)]|nr:hypothetical protein AB833_11860 [Chromatiales bacterium (ex Bugula neritina AB1)]